MDIVGIFDILRVAKGGCNDGGLSEVVFGKAGILDGVALLVGMATSETFSYGLSEFVLGNVGILDGVALLVGMATSETFSCSCLILLLLFLSRMTRS